MDSDSEYDSRDEEKFPGMCITGDGNDVKVGVMVNFFCCPNHCPATTGSGGIKRKIKNAVSRAGQPKNKVSLNSPT